MIIELLTEHHLEFLSLKRGCRGSSESTHFKMPHCWESHAKAHMALESKVKVTYNYILCYSITLNLLYFLMTGFNI